MFQNKKQTVDCGVSECVFSLSVLAKSLKSSNNIKYIIILMIQKSEEKYVGS